MNTPSRTKIKDLFSFSDRYFSQNEVTVRGWVRSLRKSKKICFIVVNDGSTQENLQVVVEETLPQYEKISSMLTGYSVCLTGKIVPSQGKGQTLEMQGHKVDILGEAGADYPIQKKDTSLEFLREKAHLRPRTNTFSAVFRIRHHLAYATHQFFHERGFFHLHSPIITASDCEGAGEMFRLTTLDLKNPPRDGKGEIDFSKDFFGKSTYLTVSGQLSAECFAMGMGEVYTFGPTFRAENSNTARHLAEFWMVEPEVAFADLKEIADLARDYLQYLIDFAFKNCAKDLEFLHNLYAKDLPETLKHVATSPFEMVTYTEAINILLAAISKGQKFDYPVAWDKGLQSEHERFLTEVHFKKPVIVTDYPKEIKAFYMKLNDDGKTVRAMDVLVPGIGEIMGGSQREEQEEKLRQRIQEMKLPEKDYWWYMDLRRFGTAVHSGFGMGFERAIMYITGMTNIRDVIPFPRTPNNAEF